jgi:hypothetical protein
VQPSLRSSMNYMWVLYSFALLSGLRILTIP